MQRIIPPTGTTVLWDEVAGTVSGSAPGVKAIQEVYSWPNREEVVVILWPFAYTLKDPNHDPTELLRAPVRGAGMRGGTAQEGDFE